MRKTKKLHPARMKLLLFAAAANAYSSCSNSQEGWRLGNEAEDAARIATAAREDKFQLPILIVSSNTGNYSSKCYILINLQQRSSAAHLLLPL